MSNVMAMTEVTTKLKDNGRLSPRERFIASVDRDARAAENPSFDLGYGITSYTRGAHDRLCEHLGLGPQQAEISARMLNLVYPCAEIASRLSGDLRVIAPAAPTSGAGDIELDDRTYRDEWGLVRRLSSGGLYYDFIGAPLAECRTLGECLQQLQRPVAPAERARGMNARAAAFRDEGFAVGAWCFGGVFEMLFWLRGYKTAYLDFALRPRLVEGLMDALLEIQADFWTSILRETGGQLDVALLTEDLGTQTGLMISPDQFRAIVKPRIRELIRTIKSESPGIRVLLHSDGAISAIVSDLIDIGVDILNPIQPGVAGMEPRLLKQEYGTELCFHGGLDIQQLMVRGTVAEIRSEVARLCDVLGYDGGYVIAPAHCVQPDVPPENIIAFVETVRELQSCGS